ncbi:MAG: single-stranded-DNA-specific exonuclease RecJ [Candidatus Delongbacteria bacterium]|jgi:single-stranded-DNA-specific exonuclease|nr:single-stranded-DNA-specific exonuclease RecJ [Candidatus Delongbacteria bacterium]
MDKKWQLRAKEDKEIVNSLTKNLNIDEPLANILAQRNIHNFEEARKFFRPSLNDLHDPFLMKDMDKAVERLNHAISQHQKILIYGDYDVDGTTSVALMYNYLIKFHKELGFYVPNRYDEGYGISYRGLDYADENGYDLIIALDCGIKAMEKAKYAQTKRIDLIICDHHTPGESLPDAVAVLDPKRKDCPYPYKHLSGCGVGYKLLQAFTQNNGLPEKELYNLLDLVVVSIGSDIVPITGENRILAHYGLKILNRNPQTGLKTIINLAGLDEKEMIISDIVFKIGPRINAAGRMESGKTAVELLVSKEESTALTIANQINEINDTRKTLDHDITDKALNQIKDTLQDKDKKTTVVYSESWHKGVIGIVASRLIEHHYKPTVVFTKSNGVLSGSARSVQGFNLYDSIESCSHLLDDFGGHMYAAGLTLKPENLEEFKRCFEAHVAKHILPEQLIPCIDVDIELDEMNIITPRFYRILKQFAPFGPENMKPMFVSKNVYDSGWAKQVGKNKEHLKLRVVSKPGDGLAIDAIGFGFGHVYDKITNYQPFDLCYTIEENVFMGKTSLQMMIKDIKPK